MRAHLVSKGEPTNSAAGALPASLVLCVVALSLIPLFLLWIGVDLSTPIHPPDSAALADPAARTEALHDSLQGSILHILLEWSGVLVACFTIILALVYVRETHDDVTIIIALALFASACIDAFHVLAASYVFDSASDSTNFIPLTWVIARMFHVGVIAVGISLLLVRARPTGGPRRRRFVPLVGLGFAATAYGIVHLCATVPILPQMMFPDAVVKRPWDLVPLVLCCLVGLFLMPTFHRRYRSSFSQALWLAMLPDIVTEILMTFGSTSLYDGAFHLGHFTKLVAYAVPLAGLIVDYSRTHRRIARSNERLAELTHELAHRAQELQRANADLEQFAYVASHDLRAPLRAIDSLSSWLAEDLGPALEGESKHHLELLRGRVQRMDALLSALLSYSRVGRRQVEPAEVDVGALVEDVVAMYVAPTGFQVSIAPGMPRLTTDEVALRQVFGNLVANAVKHHGEGEGLIDIGCEELPERYRFWVEDDGPGVDPAFHARVFDMFQTLKPRDQVEGSGMGLALVKKQVERCGGAIEIDSDGEHGARFSFTWPKSWPDRGDP